jgi:hypothetical protein
MEKNQQPTPVPPVDPTQTPQKKQQHILGEVSGGICLASTMVACLSLFLLAMVNL